MTPPQPNFRALPTLDRSLDLVRFLRANCDWDAAQTPQSLIRYLLEESQETADAIRGGDVSHLRDELGDLLLNLAFQIVIAEERGQFTADDVVRGLELKMRRRHPHLHGDGPRVGWEELKRREAEGHAAVATPAEASVLDVVDDRMEPLPRAHAIQARAATIGFDWPDATGARDKVREEIDEVGELLGSGDHDALEDEIGDLLFAVVNLARLSGVDSTAALRRANAKFAGRFRSVETLARQRGAAGLEELDAIWDEVKRQSREGS